jgi:hypothetical protein
MKAYRIIILALLALTGVCGARAQVVTSPYSKFGYGLLNDNASGIQRSMGGVGYAMQNGRQINAMNPASYSQVDSLTFLWDIGVDFTNLFKKENGKSGYDFGGGLDYITGQFKVAKGMGCSFGIVPYSSVGYSFGNVLDESNKFTETRSGAGGINELYVGFGYEPIKHLSVGANFSYMFGTSTNSTYIYSTSTALYERIMEIRDWNAKFGLQYSIKTGKNDYVVLGLTYSPKKSFRGHTWGVYYDTNQDTKTDSIGYTSLNGKYERPSSFGAGISYSHNDKLTGEVDFTYQNWSSAKYTSLTGFEPTGLKFDNRWKVAAGVQYTPNRRGNYFKTMMYRFGAFYDHDYINVNGNNVRDYGLTTGFSLPTPNSKTLINIGVEWRHRYSNPTELIKEDYLNITLSVNFNELWFWKNKIR